MIQTVLKTTYILRDTILDNNTVDGVRLQYLKLGETRIMSQNVSIITGYGISVQICIAFREPNAIVAIRCDKTYVSYTE